MSFWWGPSLFDELIEKATSELLPAGHENLPLFLEISDQVRSKKVSPGDAMRSFKLRLGHKNPNVQLATLSLLDTCVKNGGDPFAREIAKREFMDGLTSIIRAPTTNIDVRNKTLEIVQLWGLAAEKNPSLSYMTDTYRLLKAEGHVFPSAKDKKVSLLLDTEAAPEWTDSDVCERCRTPFTMTNRKHHCRQCGHTFCQQCSSNTMPLPHYAITEEVRVCDGCYAKIKLAKVSRKDSVPLSLVQSERSSTSNSQHSTHPQPEDTYDEDMKRAIALSLQEVEDKKRVSLPPPPKVTAPAETEEDDPDLAAAIAASLRDMNIHSTSSPLTSSHMLPPTEDLSLEQVENILLFTTLMEKVRASGRDASTDPEVNRVYAEVGTLQPKLVKSLNETIRKHQLFVQLHGKINRAVKQYDALLEGHITKVQSKPHDYYRDTLNTYPPADQGGYPSVPQASEYPPRTESTPAYPPSQYTAQSYPSVPESQAQPYYPSPSQSHGTSTQEPSGYYGYPSTQPASEVYPAPQDTGRTHQQEAHGSPYVPTSSYTTYAYTAPQYQAHVPSMTPQQGHAYPAYAPTGAQPQQPAYTTHPQESSQHYHQQHQPPARTAPADEAPLIDL